MKKIDQIIAISVCIPFALSLAGCGARYNPALQRSEAHLNQTKQNSQVVANAPLMLNEAEQTFKQARNTWKANRDRDEVDHLLYLTERKLQIANEETRKKLAETQSKLQTDESLLRAESARSRMSDAINDRDLAQAQASNSREMLIILERDIKELRAVKTERGLELTLNEDVIFEVDKAELKPGALLKLDPLIKYLRTNSAAKIVIEGHTDNAGSSSYNQDLSQRRADAVRGYLSVQGIDYNRIVSQGLGEEFPIATNNSEAGRLQNRRVQLIIS